MSLSGFTQETMSEGIITTKVTMSSEDANVNASFAVLGDLTSTTSFKNDKSRTEMNSPMTGNNTTIIDNDKKEMLVLADNPMMGKKFIKKEIENESNEEDPEIVVTETGDSKTILGYDCKGYKVSITKNGTETKMTMYVTDKIKAPNQNTATLGNKINGFPLLAILDVNQGGMPFTTTMEVTEIKNEKVDDALFDMDIPEGYTEMVMPK